MTNTISQIPSTYAVSNTSNQPNSTQSSTSDIISSFKEIISSMMMTNSGQFSDQENSSGINDMMSPMLMMILLEKLVEGQMDQVTLDAGTSSAAAGVQKATLYQIQKSEPTGRPVGGVLTQNYHPGHNGLDFGVVVGTPVEATMDGKVISAGWNDQGYGNLVIVENGNYRTYYAHLSSIPVSVGDTVTTGTTIGLSGNTGNSTGPHLHYEIRKNGAVINPTAMTLGTTA
jgi:murein DD-endopeptidase MepM/ murein hydrolase activator NlpD